ncbi:WD40-repeat-containing domain protein [Cantharellus anzutake]|uniref:WD40-repeat-containing domain protein n=1 Tax=Cantharellus anzutake TaxID=1750568 RepID=UPI001903A7F3|nr:WD40-repeat-containing domain protein [Cantharellus anzutake]KAF8339034.1 WD40-repeat-containing domain protein [Cantharellus anzutake]
MATSSAPNIVTPGDGIANSGRGGPGFSSFHLPNTVSGFGFLQFKPKEVRTSSNTVLWSCDGRRLISCGHERGIRVWTPSNRYPNAAQFEERSTTSLTGSLTNAVNCAATHPTNPDLICGGSRLDKKLVFWDQRRKSDYRVVELTQSVDQIQYSPDGIHILARHRAEGENPDTISLYDVGGSSDSLSAQIDQATFNHTGELIYLAGGSGSISILDYPSLEYLDRVMGHTKSCLSIGVDTRGRYIASGGSDALVNIWDIQDWICVRTISNAESPVVATAFSCDGEFIASSSESNYIDITESETGLHNTRVPQRVKATSLAWHPIQQQILASAGGDRKGESWISLLGQS